MSEFKILIVEDDKSIMNLISITLKINGYTFLTADCGKDGVSLCASHHPDLILLDLGLPDMDGIEVIRTIRTWANTPIVVISARGEDKDKIDALDSGADDYLTKPFSVAELLARIRAVQRRLQYSRNDSLEESVFENGDLKIDYASSLVTMNGTELHLTPIEYKLLILLAKNVGKVLTHSYIIDRIWGNGIDSDIVSLRVYMAGLRKKLKQGQNVSLIQTHVGIGYQMIRI
ncbi:MAG: response regulator transcription factor [Solobacterium sp.]|nr:response regulator transcription factor [Solobacterium sp.]